MTKVLVVEDDEAIGEIIKDYLEELEEYQVTLAENGERAQLLSRLGFDAILLDIMLPDVDGIELCGLLRDENHCPILFISCIDDTDSIVRALEMGGDDYIVKPFDPQVLHARIQANIRRVRMDQKPISAPILEYGRVRLIPKESMLCNGGERYQLSGTENRILAFLMERAGEYFTSTELYRKIWGKPSFGDSRTVLVHIHNLRKKLEDNPSNPQIIKNVVGKGYVFCKEACGEGE